MRRTRQQEMKFRTHGGKREGAGRKPKGRKAGVPHLVRTGVDRHTPQHVTLRVVPDVGRLRTRTMYRCIRGAMLVAIARENARICHASIQGNHLHLVAEADDAAALARLVQGFEISCAKRINQALGRRRGRVFADRYHTHALRSPREVRNALCYVLCNWRRHGEDRRFPQFRFDPFSTAVRFDGWTQAPGPLCADLELLPAATPQSWLLEHGWRRHGLLSPLSRPGPKEVD